MVPEFQVVVLAAGKGSRITELTSRKPKCLLPIGNLPMVYYPLKLLEKSNFKEVFLVVLETSKSEVEFALEKTDLSLNIVIITIPDSDYGTAETLRQISSYIISDFIVISCDLLTTFNIKNILNVHRKNDAALTALFFQPQDLHFTNPGPKSKNKIEKDLIGVDPVTNRLVFLASASDYEDILPLKKKLLHKHGAIRMYTKLLDAHFFVMKKWILKYLLREKNISTIKGELLPNILKKEMSNENKLQNIINNSFDTTPIKEFSSEKANIADIFSLAKNNEFDVMARSMSSYNDHSGDLYPVYMNDYIRSYALIANESLGIRNNTLHDYCKSNRVIMKYWKDIVKNKESNISSEAVIESTQLQKENCFVDAHTKIAAKTSIQTSSLGRGCVIASKTRIVDCIIMNNVTIKESCVLQNCVICDDVTIEANCNIKDTVIGSRYCVSSNSSYANEVLAEIASLMEV